MKKNSAVFLLLSTNKIPASVFHYAICNVLNLHKADVPNYLIYQLIHICMSIYFNYHCNSLGLL